MAMAPTESAYLAHIVAQMQQNITFLVEHQHITAADGQIMSARLPVVHGNQTSSATPTHIFTAAAAAPPARRGVPPPAPRGAQQARALWAYTGSDADDLSFAVGDVVEIVEETNADWWTGRMGAKRGLFPSNYVEKISAPETPNHSYAPATGEKVAYRPFGAALHGHDLPPAAHGGQVNSVGLQEAPGQEQKKSKFGKFGNTMAHSAAGGVGFGAGAAIGGGLVRAIF